MTPKDYVERMKTNFSAMESLIKIAEQECKEIHEKSGGVCWIGTDCPFHAAFEINTEYGCRLKGLKSIMQKRPRRKERES